jgi:ribosomal protein S18 acetylase RimI-like enzyme
MATASHIRFNATVSSFVATLPINRPAGGTVFQRLRMELFLQTARLPVVETPPFVSVQSFTPQLCYDHVSVLHNSFRKELDGRLLPTLASVAGCIRLMQEAMRSQRLISRATLLALDSAEGPEPPVPCAAIQVLVWQGGTVLIQNLAVLPEYRGRRLGRLLLTRALRACRSEGFQRVQLDVTASNLAARRLYESLGFFARRTFLCRVKCDPSQNAAADVW